jgi:predicted nucleic acid-binding protein
MIVVDASAMLAILLDEQSGAALVDVLQGHDSLLAPWLLPYEVANGLIVAERGGRRTEAFRQAALSALLECPWSFDGHARADRLGQCLALAAKHGLSSYDAAYLELALRHQCALLTLDAPLARAARAAGVAVLPKLAR